MLIADTWKDIYQYFEWISEYEPWKDIRETDPIVIERPGKPVVYVRILGDDCNQCGIACYFSREDYLVSHAEQTYHWCEDEHFICQQSALIGLWGFEEYVSRYNMNILKELDIHLDGNDLLPHFDKYEYGYAPAKIKTEEAAELADVLKHVYMALEYVYARKRKYPKNMVLLRQYDAEARKWITGFGTHSIQQDLENFYFEITDSRIENLRTKKGKGTWHVLMDLEFDLMTEPKTRRQYYETSVIVNKVLPKSQKTIFEERFTPEEISEGALWGTLYWLIEELGKPEEIEFADDFMEYKLVDFCRKADIRLVDRTKEGLEELKKFIEDHRTELEDMFAHGQNEYENTIAGDVELSEFEDKSFVLSVSLGTGLYRHIRISAAATFEELHEGILDAYGFVDDHLHMFTLRGVGLFRDMEIFSRYMEDAELTTDAYILGQILAEDMKFKYLFDFGDNWEFTIKVLHLDDVPCDELQIIRSKGEAPKQYPDLYDDETEE